MTRLINQIEDSLIRIIEVMTADRAMAYCEGFIDAGVEIRKSVRIVDKAILIIEPNTFLNKLMRT